MASFIRICFLSFTMWVAAAFINGLLFAVVFSLGELIQDDFTGSLGLATLFSLIFSVPAAFFLWLVFLTNAGSEKLPVTLLKAAFVLSSFSCLLIRGVPESVYNGHWFLLAVMIVSSSVIAVLLHHSIIRSFNKQQHV